MDPRQYIRFYLSRLRLNSDFIFQYFVNFFHVKRNELLLAIHDCEVWDYGGSQTLVVVVTKETNKKMDHVGGGG